MEEGELLGFDARHKFELCRNAHFPGMYEYEHCALCHRITDDEIHDMTTKGTEA